MTGLAVALAAAYGTFLLYTALVLGWRGLGPGQAVSPIGVPRGRADRVTALDAVTRIAPPPVAAASALAALTGGALTFSLFGSALPAAAVACFTATAPLTLHRAARERRRAEAREAWPRMIEEIRLLAGAVGRSIPQALFDVGRAAPEEMRRAFAAAEREWLVSTDFPRTVSTLKDWLADPTADATLETLLVAHQVGGSDLDRRLGALVEDRIQDLQGRKDARAKQAGVRFARRFVLLVPAGMAVAGLSIGSGRSAYQSGHGQLVVAMGVGLVAACWCWAGRLLRLPEEERVFR